MALTQLRKLAAGSSAMNEALKDGCERSRDCARHRGCVGIGRHISITRQVPIVISRLAQRRSYESRNYRNTAARSAISMRMRLRARFLAPRVECADHRVRLLDVEIMAAAGEHDPLHARLGGQVTLGAVRTPAPGLI